MELYGLILFATGALGMSSVLAIIALAVRRLRRFSLAIFVTPPASVVLLIFSGWFVIDNSPVCGPNAEWDRCPSISFRVAGWVGWLLITLIVAVAAYWGQKVVQSAVHLWFDSRTIHLFKDRSS